MLLPTVISCLLAAGGPPPQAHEEALRQSREELHRLYDQLQAGFTLRADGEVITLRGLRVRGGGGVIDPRAGSSQLEAFEYPHEDRPLSRLSLDIVRDGDRQYISVKPRTVDPRQRNEEYAIPAEYLIHDERLSLALNHRERVLVQMDASRLSAAEPDTLPAPHQAVLAAFAGPPEAWVSRMSGERPENLQLHVLNEETQEVEDRLRVTETVVDQHRHAYERVIEYSSATHLPVQVMLRRSGRVAGGTWSFRWEPVEHGDRQGLVVSGRRLVAISGETVLYVDPKGPPHPSRLVTWEIKQFGAGAPLAEHPVIREGRLERLELPEGYEYSDHRTESVRGS